MLMLLSNVCTVGRNMDPSHHSGIKTIIIEMKATVPSHCKIGIHLFVP